MAAPLVLHIGAGVAARLYRRAQAARWYGAEERQDRKGLAWPRVSVQSATGFALSWLVAGHVVANRIVPLVYEGGSSGVGLQFVAHGFAKHPGLATVGYTAFVTLASYHAVRGWAKWLGVDAGDGIPSRATERGREKRRVWFLVNGFAAAVAGLWLAGGVGVVGRAGPTRGWIGAGYDDLYRKIPVVGRWL